MASLLETAASNAVVAVVLAVVVFAVARGLRKPALAHGLWIVVLLKFLTPSIIAIPLPAWWPTSLGLEVACSSTEAAARSRVDESISTGPQALAEPGWQASPQVGLPVPAGGDSGGAMGPSAGTSFEFDAADEREARAAHSGQPLAAPVPVTSQEPRGEPRAIGWALSRVVTILMWGWLAGSLAAFTLAAVRIYRFRRVMRWAMPASAAIQEEAVQIARRIGLRDCPRVWLVPGAVSPMLWAIFGHARLLFPSRLLEGLAPAARRALLLHELAHLRRRDHWVRLLEATATILYWWHPVVWWARREIQAAEETCCDSWVVSGMPEDRGVYAAALIETDRFLSESHLALPALASGVQGFMVMKRRVTMIMRMPGEGPNRLSPVAWAGLLTFAAICLPLLPTLAQVPQGSESPAAAAAPPVEATVAIAPAEVQPSLGPAVAAVFPEPAGLESLPHRGVGRRARHIWSLAFSPDGRTIAVGSGEWDLAGELHLLDVATGKALARERVRQGVASVAFSPDGTLVASCSWHGHLRIHKTDELVLVHDIPLQSVARVAFSPDGKTIATAAEGWSKDDAPGRKVQLWDVATGEERRLLDDSLFRLHCVAFSPDGNLVAAGGGRWEQNRMGEVRLWDAQTGKEVARLIGHRGPVFGLEFSPDGKTVATGSFDATIRFWDSATGQQQREIQAHNAWVGNLAFSPDGKLLASSSSDGTAKLWDAATGQGLATFAAHDGWSGPARFSPDGATVVSVGQDGKVQIWDVAKREKRRTIAPPEWLADPAEPITCVAYSPDGKTIVSAHESKNVRLREAATGDVRTLLVGHTDVVRSVAYSPDGKTLATASCDKTVKLWDAATGQARTTLEGHTDWVLAAVFSPDGKTIASCSSDKTVRLWDPATGRELARLEGHNDLVRFVAFSPDGKRLASTGARHTVKVWDIDTREEVLSLSGSAGTAVVFSPDGNTLASPAEGRSGARPSEVHLWDAKTGQLRSTLAGHRTVVLSLAFSPGGKTLAGGSLDGSIVLWDVASGKSLQEVRPHEGPVTTLAFAPDSSTLVSGGADATVNLWNTKSRPIPPLLTFVPGHGAVRSVAFSPDGRTLATSGEDGKARLWAFPALECQRELGDYLGPATCLAFSPDGRHLALGGTDRRITVWDTRDGRRLAQLTGHKGEVTSLRFSPDGKRLASSAHDSEVRVWDVEAVREVFQLKHLIISQCLDWSPDGRLLCASAEEAGESESSHPVILWNAETGHEIARLRGHRSYVTLVRFSPDGKRLATSASDTQLHLWDVATRKILGSMTAQWGAPDARFLPDGQTLAVAMHVGRFGLWDLSTFREAIPYEGHGPFTVGGTYGWGIYGVAVSPDGSVVASTDSRGLVKFWPTLRGTSGPTSAAASLAKLAAATGPVMPPPGAGPAPSGLVYSVAAQKSGVLFATFSPDGKLLAAGGEDGTLVFLEAEKGRVLKTVPANEGAILTGAFSPDGRQFATAGSGNSVKRWDVDSGEQIGSFSGPAVLTRTLTFTGSGESLVSANDAGLFRRWDTETGRELSKADLSPMAWMALSPDGKLAATANRDWTAGVWNLQDFKQVAVLKGHVGAVISTAFSPDGRLLVSTSAGVGVDPKENVKLWDTESWTERAALEGHRGYVHCATFSPDGKTIATCGADLTIRLWNAADGKPLKTLRGHTASVVFVRFSPDGRRLASASLDGTVKVWNLGFDSSTASRETLPVSEVYGLKHARADAIAKELTSLFAGQKNCRFAADAQKNALVVFAPLDQRNKIQEKIRSLDVPASPDRNTLNPKESQKPPGTSAPAPTSAAGAPVQLEAIEGLDVLIVRGNRRDVAQLMEAIKQVDALSPTNAPAIKRLNGLLFSQGYRAVVRDGKIVVAPVIVKLDFAFKPWSEVVESLAKQMDLSVEAPSLPPGTFNYRDTREHTPTEALELLDSLLRTKGYAIALRDYKLVVTASSPSETEAAARQSESMNQLKHIALAMHNYHDVHKTFPPAYRAENSGRPLLSWRVLILPYLDQNSLYREFHLDEPWDSQHNKKLIERMPAAYRSPGSKTAPGMTNYLTVRAPNAVFPGKDGVSIRQITDGTSNTIMVVEASEQKAVAWTKPDDFEYNEADPLAGLLGLRPKGFLAALCDGAALLIPSSVEKETLRRLFVRNDGQPIPSPLGSAAEEQRWTVQIVDDSAVIQATESTANRLIQATIHAIQESGTEKFTLRRIDKPGSTVRDAKQTFSIRMIGSEAEIACSRDVPYKYLANMIQRLREAGVRKTKIASTSEERPER